MTSNLESITVPAEQNQDPSVDEGSFLYDRLKLLDRGFTLSDHNTPMDCYGLRTPVDEQTGLPLPILPIPAFPHSKVSSFSDYHHHYHPRPMFTDTRFGGDDSLTAVRMSRGQQLPRWLHEHYHHFFSGPDLPSSRTEAFKLAVLGCAGVMPAMGIDFTGGNGPVMRELSGSEQTRTHKTIRREGEHRHDRGRSQRNKIGFFFANYAVEQAVETAVSDRVIDQFLFSHDKRVRIRLGNFILDKALDMSVDPIRPLYKEVRPQLPPYSQSDPRKVVGAYFVASRRFDYHDALAARLEAA